MKLSHRERWALEIITENPGITMIGIAAAFNVPHPIYGKQRAASTVIARLRHLKLIADCPRCPVCHRALSRSRRNVPLYAIGAGPGKEPDLFSGL